MRFYAILTTLFVGLTLSLTACDKKGEEAAGDKAEGAAEAAPAGPVEQDAQTFVTEFQGLKGMEVMKRYKDGVIVSGKVKRTLTEMNDALKVMLDAGDGKWVSLSFTDNGAAAKAGNVEAGADFKAKCKVGGGMEQYVMLIDCEKL